TLELFQQGELKKMVTEATESAKAT
ncbi:hypothetical protein MNBD_GAMMA19-164, partial [hydrothermal vent metagenome]